MIKQNEALCLTQMSEILSQPSDYCKCVNRCTREPILKMTKITIKI